MGCFQSDVCIPSAGVHLTSAWAVSYVWVWQDQDVERQGDGSIRSGNGMQLSSTIVALVEAASCVFMLGFVCSCLAVSVTCISVSPLIVSDESYSSAVCWQWQQTVRWQSLTGASTRHRWSLLAGNTRAILPLSFQRGRCCKSLPDCEREISCDRTKDTRIAVG